MRELARNHVDVRIARKSTSQVLNEIATASTHRDSFDIFLSHSILDSEIILGIKIALEQTGKTVYVDWLVDPQLDRNRVNAATAEKLRARMRQCKVLLYAHSKASQSSRWMPWELGYFDGLNGNVAVLPIYPDQEDLSYSNQEYLLLYPKAGIEITFGRDTISLQGPYGQMKSIGDWMAGSDKLRPRT
jgi:hypothetical protein